MDLIHVLEPFLGFFGARKGRQLAGAGKVKASRGGTGRCHGKETELRPYWKIRPQSRACATRWSGPVKDIHDLHGVHGNRLKHAAVTLVVHHHHEEVAAGDLLDHKGPAGGRKRDVAVVNVWESRQQGSPRAIEDAGRVSGRLVSPLAVSKHTRQTRTNTKARTHISITRSIPSSSSHSPLPASFFWFFSTPSKPSPNDVLPNLKHTKGRQMGTTPAALHRGVSLA